MSEGAVHPNASDEGASAIDQITEMLVSGEAEGVKEEAHQIGEPDNVTDTEVDYDEET